MELAERIAKYAVKLKYEDLGEHDVHAAKRVMIDTFGCAVNAAKEPPIAMAMKSIDYRDGKKASVSTILGTERTTSPQLAAFINGGMARYLDYNDDYDAKEFSHPSDNIMPILAVAEAEKKSGKEIILAVVLAYQIQCSLADSAALWRNGWDHVNYGLVSVAAAASKLMGLGEKQTAEAINIALSSSLSLRQVRAGRISMWKAFAFSNAARNAVFAAGLAKNGVEGPSPVFEGEMGFFKEVSGKFSLSMPDHKFKINDTTFKFYPVEMRAQSAVSCALDIRKKLHDASSISSIESILIKTTEGGYKILGSDRMKWAPKNKETADHSLPYVVASALVDGTVTAESYSSGKLNDKNRLALMRKTKVVIAKEFTAKDVHIEANEVIVRMKDGTILSSMCRHPKGHPMNPMSDLEIETKFFSLVKKHLKRDAAETVLEMLWSFQNIKRIDRLFSVLRFW
jgi:2-methylcitrate dehydratase